ncbi:MAG: hypothetical protein F4048_08420 [Gammaproteobacteria bacterium]|nr:hypothetical protein [Gammaproteobacteria bacterium]
MAAFNGLTFQDRQFRQDPINFEGHVYGLRGLHPRDEFMGRDDPRRFNPNHFGGTHGLLRNDLLGVVAAAA